MISCFFFSSRRRHTRFSRDWSSDVCSSDLAPGCEKEEAPAEQAGTRSPRHDSGCATGSELLNARSTEVRLKTSLIGARRMNDKDQNKNAAPETEKQGLSRRSFLGATAMTGATALAGATGLGSAVMTRESWAQAVKDAHSKIVVKPGELDTYYGFWSGG